MALRTLVRKLSSNLSIDTPIVVADAEDVRARVDSAAVAARVSIKRFIAFSSI